MLHYCLVEGVYLRSGEGCLFNLFEGDFCVRCWKMAGMLANGVSEEENCQQHCVSRGIEAGKCVWPMDVRPHWSVV